MKKKSASQTAQKLSKKVILLTITALALCASPDSRADQLCYCLRYWDNLGTGDWFNASNWGPGHNDVPNCAGVSCPPLSGASQVDINNGGTAQISGLAQTARACETFLGYGSVNSGNLFVDHGTLDQCSLMWVGYDGKGTLKITNGGLVTTLLGGLIAAHAGSNGAVTVDGTNPDGRKSTWTVTGGLYVGGTNSSAGGTGLLTVANQGRVNAANVRVWNSGTLTGNGTVTTTNGTTTIDGTLAPSGTLTIDGNLTFANPNATMQCNVTPSSWDRAEVSGTATLNGKLSVKMTGTFTTPVDFALLHASTLVGTFSSFSATYTGCLAPSIVYDYDNGYVYLHVESTC